MLTAIDEANHRDDVGCVVLRGAGRSFCSGDDFAENSGLLASPDNAYDKPINEDIRSLNSGPLASGPRFWYSQIPIIAEVHGYCLVEGLSLACNCDLIVASEDAKFGYPTASKIMSPPNHMFTYLMGTQWTRYLLYTGDYIDGPTAASIGLALWCVPDDELEERTAALARRIAVVPRSVLAFNKAITEKALDLMGRPMLQQLAKEANAMGHKSPVLKTFYEAGHAGGFKAGFAAAAPQGD
jgi:enoyl-CoA hydratase